MLPVRSRVSSREEHARIGREGRRFSCSPLIVHALSTRDSGPARAGFVVSRKVGTAVTRNRVRRRLREQTRSRLASVPPGTLLVIRALPASAEASSAELGSALDRGLAAMRAGRARSGQDRSARARATTAKPRPATGQSDDPAKGSAAMTRPGATAGVPDDMAASPPAGSDERRRSRR
ncbi:ribonuclease P protein component [Pseudofrankia asymbiotica]|uniref:ribonuclease P protein component n=1 Tax=Pseudofrankia asymbiotica TaxID=1834516 RepID=UPI0009D6B3DC